MPAFRVVGTSTVATRRRSSTSSTCDVRGPDGEVHQRYVVRHPGAVVVVPVEDDGDDVLLVRQYRAAVDGDLLEVPAGKRDVDGEPPEATAHRELEEEIGHRARTARPAGRVLQHARLLRRVHVPLRRVRTRLRSSSATRRPPRRHAMQVERVALADVPG